jgi:H+/Cl- antiporter ClcA
VHENASQGDFAANAHLLRITAIAGVIGALSTVTAYVLLHLIDFFTNLFFQSLSFDSRSPAGNTLGLSVVVIPVIGGLVIGLIARYGSEAMRDPLERDAAFRALGLCGSRRCGCAA